MADFGDYYNETILAAADLALFDSDPKRERQVAAVRQLETASARWKAYAAVATSHYTPHMPQSANSACGSERPHGARGSRHQTGEGVAPQHD